MGAFGTILATADVGFRAGRVAWSPDGRSVAAAYWELMLFGPSPTAPVTLLDAETGAVRWRSAAQPACMDLVFAPGGDRLALGVTTLQQRAAVLMLDAGTGAELWRREQPVPWSLWFSPDGRYLAVVDQERVRVLDPGTGRELHDLGAPGDLGGRTDFSPDSRWYAAAIGSELRLVATQDAGVRWTAVLPRPVLRAGFTDDGARLVAVTQDTVVTLDVESGEARSSVRLERPVNLPLLIDRSMELSPDRTRYVRPGARELGLWSLADGHRIDTEIAPSTGSPTGWSWDPRVAFGPDGRLVALAPDGVEGTALVAPATGAVLHRDPASTASIAFAPEGERLATGGVGGVRIIDVAARLSRRRFGGPITAVAAASAGIRMGAAASKDPAQTVVVFQADSGEALLTYGDTRSVNALEFGTDGETYATGGADGFVDVRRIASGRLSSLRLEGPVNALVYDPRRADRLVTGSADKTVRLLTLDPPPAAGLSEVWRYLAGRAVSLVAPAPSGELFAAADAGFGVVVLRASTGERVGLRLEHRGRVVALSFGALLASGSEDGSVFLIDPSGTLVAEIGHLRSVTAVAAAPDGTYLVTADAAGLVRVFDTTAGKPVALSERTYPEKVRRLSFHPGGRRLAVVAAEAPIVRIIDPAGGAESVRLIHPGPVTGLAFSHDGSLLITACEDGTARVFPGEWP